MVSDMTRKMSCLDQFTQDTMSHDKKDLEKTRMEVFVWDNRTTVNVILCFQLPNSIVHVLT